MCRRYRHLVAAGKAKVVVTTAIARASFAPSTGEPPRYAGCALSQRHRKKIEEPFGWAETVGGMAPAMLRGLGRVGGRFILTMAAANLARLPRLLAA
jgi:hypothetical protein